MKFYGTIGFGKTFESSPGVWDEHVEEREYYGDIIRNTNRFQTTDKVNDDLTISNEFSIIADPYALEQFAFMRYILYMNIKWKITNIDIQYPRIIISVGGVYNG